MDQTSSEDGSVFDIIIIGAGTAGCVLASRLSEDPKLQVLLIEAGPNCNSDPRVTTPGRASECQRASSEINWNFVSEPQEHLNGRTISHPRGKVVGGSSAINSHAIVLPSCSWLDSWSEYGNKGWGAEHMVPYYHKFYSLTNTPREVTEGLKLAVSADANALRSGPVKSSYPTSIDPLTQAWVDTFDSAGHYIHDDILTGPTGVGGTIIPGATAHGERSHAGVAYLEPALTRANLTVLDNTAVERIMLESDQEHLVRATGVQCRSLGMAKTFRARKEVVVCAGALQTPQILELSGIGDPDLLRSLNITEVVANPFVGENLQDHLNCGLSYEVNPGTPTFDDARAPGYAEEGRRQYQRDKTGPLSSSGCNTFGYSSLQMFDSKADTDKLLAEVDRHIASDLNANTLPSQDLQESFIRRMIADAGEATATIYLAALQRNLDQPEAKRKALLQPGNYFTLIAMLSYPFSRGSVHIRSADPAVKPAIDFRYLSHELDVEVLGRHMAAFDERLVKLEPIASFLRPGGQRLPKSFPGKIDSAGKARDMLRQCAGTNYHPACTCPMMSRELGGVVNDRLVVYGTANLRVCDASIFPIIPTGNILSSVYACAEKGADIIKEDIL